MHEHDETAMGGRPKAELVLSESGRDQLTALAMRRKTAQALALRARIVLTCADGIDNKTVAAKLWITQQTVSKWRGGYVMHRLDGLLDAPRPGAPRSIDDTRVDAVIAKTLESMPKGATHSSTRPTAREMSLSQTAVSRIWRAFGLRRSHHGPNAKGVRLARGRIYVRNRLPCPSTSVCYWEQSIYVKRHVADPHLAADLRDRRAQLGLLQRVCDLLFGELAPLHGMTSKSR